MQEYLRSQDQRWESLCRRCGACCGSYDDPCRQLRREGDKYYCAIYPTRLGEQVTVAGQRFNCVPIADLIHSYWKNDHLCAYKQIKFLGGAPDGFVETPKI